MSIEEGSTEPIAAVEVTPVEERAPEGLESPVMETATDGAAKVDSLEVEISQKEEEIAALSNSIEETKKNLHTLESELGLPLTENPPSIEETMRRIEELKQEKEALAAERNTLQITFHVNIGRSGAGSRYHGSDAPTSYEAVRVQNPTNEVRENDHMDESAPEEHQDAVPQDEESPAQPLEAQTDLTEGDVVLEDVSEQSSDSVATQSRETGSPPSVPPSV